MLHVKPPSIEYSTPVLGLDVTMIVPSLIPQLLGSVGVILAIDGSIGAVMTTGAAAST